MILNIDLMPYDWYELVIRSKVSDQLINKITKCICV